MSQMTHAIQDIPLAALIPIGLLVIVGLFMWSAGRRLLKVAFAAAGLVLGGGVGWAIGAAVPIAVPAWIWAAVIGLVFACVAALAYRIAVAAALGLVLAVAAPLAVVTVAEIQGLQPASSPSTSPLASPESDLPDELTRFFAEQPGEPDLASLPPEVRKQLEDILSGLKTGDAARLPAGLSPEMLEGLGITLPEGTVEQIEQARAYAETQAGEFRQAVRAWWADTPENLRPAIIGSAIAGFLVGLLFGTLASSFAASVVTAFGGSLLWLNGARIMVTAVSEPIAQKLPTSAAVLLALWLIISLVGVAIQWMIGRKPADKNPA